MRELRLWRKERQLISKLDSHHAKVVEAVDALISGLPEIVAGDKAKLKLVRDKIRRLEKEADQIARDLEKELARRSLKRSDREDLLRLVFHFETIADHAEAAADELHTVRFELLGEPVRESLLQFSTLVGQAARQIHEASNMFERDNEAAIELGDQVSVLEEQADEARRKLNDVIGLGEPPFTSWQFLSFNKLISSLEEIADAAEDASDALRIIAIARL